MPGTTIKISASSATALYEQVRNHLGSVGDLLDAMERPRTSPPPSGSASSSAKTSGCWRTSAGTGRRPRQVELTMPPHDLMEVLQRLHGEAGEVLGDTEEGPEDAETKRLFIQGQATCEQVLGLDPGAGERT